LSRGLTAGQIANLNLNSFRVEELVELNFTGVGSPFYYTTGNQSVTVTTPTSGGAQIYTPRGFISDLGSIEEKFQPEAITTAIQFQSLAGEDNMLTYASQINKRVVIYKLFRDVSTVVPDTTNGLIQLFDGVTSGLEVEFGIDTTTYTLRLTGDFGDFDRLKGRTTADVLGAMTQKTIYWGSFYLE
jgi:hypothetical protein